MGYEHLLVIRDGEFVTITMNRPERRNILSSAHVGELIDAFTAAGEGDSLGIVLAANGAVFCAGHDIRELAALDEAGVQRMLETSTSLMNLIQSVPQVVVAEVGGLATAAGCQLVASCDLAVAAETAHFSAPGNRTIGWFCHTPMVAIGRDIGRKRAMEMALTGDAVDARTALQWGLVNRVASSGDLERTTRELLSRATRGSPSGAESGKRMLYAQLSMTQGDAYRNAIEVMAAASQSPDAQEGMAAFLAKRAPQWAPRVQGAPVGSMT
jgi:enoyl-CoA hydratase/carnithine racemase